MTPTTIIEQAAVDGVTITLTPAGKLKAYGPNDALGRWLSTLRDYKPAIIKALALRAEFHRRLEWIADHMDADLDDLLDWYSDDTEAIVTIEGKGLLSIVKEYLCLRDYYRGRIH